MAVDSPLLEQCFDRVLREAPGLLGRCLDAAVDTLAQAEARGREVADRELASRAAWTLQRHRAQLIAQYPVRLRHAFHEASPDGPTSSLARMSDSSLLSLVDDSSVNESVESARMLQTLAPVVDQALAMVDARMSSLIGLDTVHAEKNPLRPSVFVRALRHLMSEHEPDPRLRSLGMQHMTSSLANELSQLYETVARLLQQARVQEAGYRIRLVADGPPTQMSTRGWLEDGAGHSAQGQLERVAPTDTADAPAALRMKDLAREQSPLQHGLMQAFMSGEPGAFEQRLDNAFYEQVRRELAQVDVMARLPQPDPASLERERQQFRDLPAVDRPARQIDVHTALDPEVWGDGAAPHERSRVLLELKHQADKVSQAIGLDVVRTLVAQVSRDPLLLAPVREAVVALEPALLRLAMAEPRYFNRSDHPARQWMEAVAQRSFRHNDEFSPAFQAFFAPVQAQVRALNATGSADPQPFAAALDELQSQWHGADREEAQHQQRQLDALSHAEQRQELADQIAWEISLRPDVYNAPGIVLDFLYGSWSLVIASAELGQGGAGADPAAFRKVIGQLLWSTHSQVTLRQPQQLFEVVPGMLQTLRRGLDLLGKTPGETQAFFDALLKLHEPVLKLRRARARSDGQSAVTPPLDVGPEVPPVLLAPATPEQQKPRPSDQPWLAQRELAGAGFADTEQIAEEPQEAPDTSESPAPTTHLRTDDWVDLRSGGEWLRARLVWRSAKGSLFLFVSQGGRPHSMTRRTFDRLVAQRWLRPVGNRPVVERAIRRVAAGDAVREPR
ncbi:DUF1631 family protein [Hydrogenophaga sp.]|uniref:DUF1631 family protein n=1 Tax=Hydrogenophaga sp. TaxID=1904254 RepID=UPI0035AE0D8C